MLSKNIDKLDILINILGQISPLLTGTNNAMCLILSPYGIGLEAIDPITELTFSQEEVEAINDARSSYEFDQDENLFCKKICSKINFIYYNLNEVDLLALPREIKENESYFIYKNSRKKFFSETAEELYEVVCFDDSVVKAWDNMTDNEFDEWVEFLISEGIISENDFDL